MIWVKKLQNDPSIKVWHYPSTANPYLLYEENGIPKQAEIEVSELNTYIKQKYRKESRIKKIKKIYELV